MKLVITEKQFNEAPPLNKLFLALWLKRKGYLVNKELSFGQLIELALALTPHLRFDSPSERTTFNNSLQYDETLIAWDGSEPIETLFFELNQKLKKRIIANSLTAG